MRLILCFVLGLAIAAPSYADDPIPPPPAGSVEPAPPAAPATFVEQLQELQAKYTAIKAEKDKSARMLLWAAGIAAALKFALDLLARFASSRKWFPLVALGAAVPIGLLTHFAGGHGWFDSVLVAGAGPGAVFVHELVKRLRPAPKTATADAGN